MSGTTTADIERSALALRSIRLAAQWIVEGRRVEMQGLAEELGVSRVTLFRNLGPREEILSEALWHLTEATLHLALRRWEAERPAGSLYSPGTGEQINALVSRSLVLHRLLAAEPALTIRVLTDPRGRVQTGVVDFVETLLRRDIDEHGLDPIADPGDLAFALVRLGESFLYADVLANRPPDIDAANRIQRALVEGTDGRPAPVDRPRPAHEGRPADDELRHPPTCRRTPDA
ncbi:QsdR family transcriptional regulator [soil metagenome]